jgi:hypothetical protein
VRSCGATARRAECAAGHDGIAEGERPHGEDAHYPSLAAAAKRIGASSHNAYARYEHGTSMPKLDTVQEILKAVAPELALTLGPRNGPKVAPRVAKAKRRSGGVT